MEKLKLEEKTLRLEAVLKNKTGMLLIALKEKGNLLCWIVRIQIEIGGVFNWLVECFKVQATSDNKMPS